MCVSTWLACVWPLVSVLQMDCVCVRSPVLPPLSGDTWLGPHSLAGGSRGAPKVEGAFTLFWELAGRIIPNTCTSQKIIINASSMHDLGLQHHFKMFFYIEFEPQSNRKLECKIQFNQRSCIKICKIVIRCLPQRGKTIPLKTKKWQKKYVFSHFCHLCFEQKYCPEIWLSSWDNREWAVQQNPHSISGEIQDGSSRCWNRRRAASHPGSLSEERRARRVMMTAGWWRSFMPL